VPHDPAFRFTARFNNRAAAAMPKQAVTVTTEP